MAARKKTAAKKITKKAASTSPKKPARPSSAPSPRKKKKKKVVKKVAKKAAPTGKAKAVKDPKRQAAGKKARDKGKTFERLIASWLREAFPKQAPLIRRTDQGHKAHLPDVAGIPGWWVECNHADNPNPERKMAQAVHDIAAYTQAHGGEGARWRPVVVLRRTRSTKIHAYLRFGDMAALITQAYGGEPPPFLGKDDPRLIRMVWEEWLRLVRLAGFEEGGGEIPVTKETESAT